MDHINGNCSISPIFKSVDLPLNKYHQPASIHVASFSKKEHPSQLTFTKCSIHWLVMHFTMKPAPIEKDCVGGE